MTFHTDRGPAGGGSVASSQNTVSAQVDDARWVRAEVRRADGTMVAFTNPIWLGMERR